MTATASPERPENEILTETEETPSVWFGEDAEKTKLESAALGRGDLVVRFDAPGPSWRGRLGLLVEGAIEAALDNRGAPPPGVGASSDLDSSLSDQLYRSRMLGSETIVLSFPRLEGVANLAGALDAEDSAVIRWWIAATGERPIRILLDAADRFLGIYGPPVAFADLIGQQESVDEPPAAAPEQVASVAAMDLAEADDETDVLPIEEAGAEQSTVEARNEAEAVEASHEIDGEPPIDEPLVDEDLHGGEIEEDLGGATDEVDFGGDVDELEPAETADPEPAPSDEGTGEADRQYDLFDGIAISTRLAERAPTTGEADRKEDDWSSEPAEYDQALESLRSMSTALETEPPPAPQAERVDLDEVLADAGAETSNDEPRTVRPIHPRAKTDWKVWSTHLGAARGPKPLSVVERLFVSAYTPLRDALLCGIADPGTAKVADAWAESFEKSYSEAFDALRLRGKRPTMVLDVPDIASRVARLHGARSIELLLVDGMRFDLGLRMHETLKGLAGGRAACTERLLLWSALPSDTTTQLELIGRGPQGLTEPLDEGATPVPLARGRAAKQCRRVKTHQRDVLKLDLVEARLSMPGGQAATRIDSVAKSTAQAIADHFETLEPRTLVMVFGDHGFQLDPLDGGTTAMRHGGASPEEVLVPAFAWLVGDMH